MKYLRRQILSSKTITGHQSIYIDINGEAVVDQPYSVLIPKGTTAQRSPDTTAPTYVNGMFRYNSQTAEFEGYQSGAWRSFRFKESTNITQQSVGTGDGSTILFGPLNPAPPSVVESSATWGGQNLIVLVENVFQLHTTNYTIVQNPPGGYTAGYYLQFTSAVPALKPVTVLHGFDK